MVKDVDDYYKIPEFVIDLNKQEYKGIWVFKIIV